MVNGGNVNEGVNQGTAIVPNLDSIAEFRILTNNFDAEYGNYSGGQVNAITKSGTNEFHGDLFDFLRNTDLDARNFYSPDRGTFIQNEFGGTIGGPILKDKLFFFGDYQGTRQIIGTSTGEYSGTLGRGPSRRSLRHSQPAHRNGAGKLLGESAGAKAWLWCHSGRALLCAWMYSELGLRFSQRGYPAIGDHDAISEAC